MELKQGAFLQDEKYRIIRTLGQGGFGITYLAEQVLAGRMVCIKEFFPKEYYNRDADSRHITVASQSNVEFMERFKEKFMKEAKTIARLDHPNIIHIHDVFKENNTGYYVMEYIEGISLYDMVRRNGVLSVEVATRYIREVAAALEHIHGQRINHLDIKPGNIMVRKSDNRAILIDFGLSKQYDEAGNQTSSTPVGISQGFAPMEQYKAGGVSEFSPTSDIYSLGATLFYLLTATVPPMASDIVENGLPALIQQLPTNIKRAIESSMEVRRRDRPQTVADFLKILDGAPVASPATEIAMPNEASAATPVAQPKQESTPKSEQTPVQPPKPEPKPAPRVEPKPAETPKTPTPTPKKSSKAWLIVLAVVLIGGGVGGWLIYDKIQERVRIETEQQRIDNMVTQGLGRDGVYQVGDYYNRDGKQGVVFEVWNGGRNGKIVSLHQAEKQWCTHSQYDKEIVTGAESETDGKANTDKIMRRSDSSEYPAFVWCRNEGNDWYLPAKDELLAIRNAKDKINNTMLKCGVESLIGRLYWTSTEYSDDDKFCAWLVYMGNGGGYDGKRYNNNVRAVSVF